MIELGYLSTVLRTFGCSHLSVKLIDFKEVTNNSSGR